MLAGCTSKEKGCDKAPRPPIRAQGATNTHLFGRCRRAGGKRTANAAGLAFPSRLGFSLNLPKAYTAGSSLPSPTPLPEQAALRRVSRSSPRRFREGPRQKGWLSADPRETLAGAGLGRASRRDFPDCLGGRPSSLQSRGAVGQQRGRARA